MNILFIGGGNMGFALAGGLLKSDQSFNISVAEPLCEQRERFKTLNIQTFESNTEACQGQDVIVLAVKPQVIESVSLEVRPYTNNSLILSIAAGTSLTQLEKWFGQDRSIVRAMPNTPALIGEGITGLVASSATSKAHQDIAAEIFATCGDVLWFASDDQLNAVTALSGSGPAYFFYVMEALAAAGEELGLSEDQVFRLVSKTTIGSGRLAIQDDVPPSVLRERVTSPGGTTEAATQFLDSQNVKETIKQAAIMAYQRARELSG